MPIIAGAFERRPHHKFQAIARVEQGEETEHNKIGAGQPVPHQRKGANKEAEKGEGAIGRCSRLSVIAFLLWKMRYSAQTVMHSMISTFASAPNCTLTGWK